MPEIRVYDQPRGQQRHRTGKGREYTPTATLQARHWIAEAWREAGHGMIRGAVRVDVTAIFARPRAHYGTGRNADKLKPSAPRWPTTRSSYDRDNLDKLVLDALSKLAFEDDSFVVDGKVCKVYARGGWIMGEGPTLETPGWIVGVWPMEGRGFVTCPRCDGSGQEPEK